MTDKVNKVLGQEAIQAFLPHRAPFLFIDRVLDFNESYVTAIKNVTISEDYFAGHFPGLPVMPGVIQIETMAQTAAFLAYDTTKGSEKKAHVLFLGIEKAKFRKIVSPGDQLLINVELEKRKGDFWFTKGTITVENKIVCEAKMSAILKIMG